MDEKIIKKVHEGLNSKKYEYAIKSYKTRKMIFPLLEI
ncbi:MAG: hypothetical protein H6Q43_773 [Deltaproteobacteria bacterium]|jgi:hypothetical protein|nr:hypothetical protein [Deltaproteobacteria bacterium]MBP1717335.1 hypothetical protein [Deltaproteobacteria bacterium]